MQPLYEVYLDPPVGTCYFKSYKHRLSGEWRPQFPFPLPTLILNATIEVTFYIYITLAKPTDPDFTRKGGKVYIVAVYNGSTALASHLDFGIEDLSGLLSPVDQLPVPGTEVRNGDTRVYTIDFAQNMSMYSNGGNSGYIFPARYNRVFSLTGHIQSRYQTTSWSLKNDESARTHEKPFVNGLQIFQTNKLAVAKCRVFFILRFASQEKVFSQEFDLDFSAETMRKAVVG